MHAKDFASNLLQNIWKLVVIQKRHEREQTNAI